MKSSKQALFAVLILFVAIVLFVPLLARLGAMKTQAKGVPLPQPEGVPLLLGSQTKLAFESEELRRLEAHPATFDVVVAHRAHAGLGAELANHEDRARRASSLDIPRPIRGRWRSRTVSHRGSR